MITFMRPAVRRLGAALVTATLAGAALAAPAAAQDPEAGSGASGGSLPGAGLGLSDLLALATTGSASNENAPLLAPLSSGFGPLSAAPDTPGYGSAVTPAMLGVTLMLSLVPVGSLAAATPVLAGVGSGERVDAAVGSLTGRGPASPEPDPTITRSEVLAKTPVDDPIVPGRLEIWTVTSASMGRKVELEVFLPGGDAPAPMLYSLDGIDTLLPSGFRTLTSGPRRAFLEGFSAVSPTGATASNFTDWIQDDPRLGRNKWETFLNTELPPLLEQDPRLRFNGKRGVIGVSMGAGSALQLAAAAPGHYAAAAGVSGCYSTLSDLGYQTLRLGIETRGGNLDNMWGPRGSELWQQHNLPDHAEKFRGTKVFLSAATGAIGREDAAAYGDQPGLLLAGYALEAGSYECTNEFSHALDDAGIDHDLYLKPTGVHNWTTFTPTFDIALDSILPTMR